jgi:hypothetical protein
MWRKNQILRIDSELLDDFADVAMIEDGICRQIVSHGNEMRLSGGLLPRARNSRLGIGDDAAAAIDQA